MSYVTYVVDVSPSMGQPVGGVSGQVVAMRFIELALRVAYAHRSQVSIITFGASVHVDLPLSGLFGVEVMIVVHYCAIDTTPVAYSKIGILDSALSRARDNYKHAGVTGEIFVVTDGRDLDQFDDVIESFGAHAVGCVRDPAVRCLANATAGNLIDVCPVFALLGVSCDVVVAAARACRRRWVPEATAEDLFRQYAELIKIVKTTVRADTSGHCVEDGLSDSKDGLSESKGSLEADGNPKDSIEDTLQIPPPAPTQK